MSITESEQERILGLVIELELASRDATKAAVCWSNLKVALPIYFHGHDKVIEDLHDGMIQANKNREKAWLKLVEGLRALGQDPQT